MSEPTQEELDDFIIENRQWLSEEAEGVLRSMNGSDQRNVIEEGSMSNCRDPVAIVKTRAWQGYLKQHDKWIEARKGVSHDVLMHDFLEHNMEWLNEEAEEALRHLEPDVFRQVVEMGDLARCRDPVAIVKSRAKKVRERAAKGYGKGKGSGKLMKGKGKGKGKWSSWQEEEGPKSLYEAARSKNKTDNWGNIWPARQTSVEDYPPVRKKEEVLAESQAAVDEGRSMYCVGVPPMWTTKQLEDFFAHQGKVDWVHLMPVKAGTGTRACFVNFATAEGATSAAQVCDQLEIEENGKSYVLTCSIKQRFGEKTYGKTVSAYSAGFRGRDIPLEEGRKVFLGKLPAGISIEEVQRLCKPYGGVEDVFLLPSNGMNQAAFVSMETPAEAAWLIASLNGAQMYGSVLQAAYAVEKPDKKRKREKTTPDDDEDYFVVEISNFPFWTTVDDLKATLEDSGLEIERVRILNHDPNAKRSLARAYVTEEKTMNTAAKLLHGFEFTPGYPLQAKAVRPKQGDDEQLEALVGQQQQQAMLQAAAWQQPGVAQMAAHLQAGNKQWWSW